MANLHRLHFLKSLSKHDWNDLYHSSHSFIYSLKNTFEKNLKKNKNYLKSKNLIFYETLMDSQKLLTKSKFEELEDNLRNQIVEFHSLDNFNKDLNKFLIKVDDFFAKQKLIEYSSEYEKQISLLYYHLLNKETDLVDKKISSIEKILNNGKLNLDSKLNIEKFQFYKKIASVNKNKKIELFPYYLDKATSSLNDYYITNIFKLACSSILVQLNYKTDAKAIELPIIPKTYIKNYISLCYYNSYQILMKIYNEDFNGVIYSEVENLLDSIEEFEAEEVYSIEDIKTLHQFKLSICIQMFTYGQNYAQLFKETFETMITKEIILEYSIIDARLFKKTIEIYSVAGYKEEALVFLEKFGHHLSAEVNRQYSKYSKALLEYKQNKLSKETVSSLESINEFKYNPQLYLSVKKLLMKIYFEAQEFDLYHNLLESTKKYIYRNKKTLPKQSLKENKNFLSAFKLIISTQKFDTVFKSKLKLEIKKPHQILDLMWLRNRFLLQNK